MADRVVVVAVVLFFLQSRINMKPFANNGFNFARCALRQIDGVKGRGVVALRPIRAGELLALFPGPETFRIPASGELPMRQWPRRHEVDEELIDEAQECMPVSDYAILTVVLDYGGDSSAIPTGYHYRVLDPMADASASHGNEMRAVLAAHRAIAPFDEPVVPDAMRPLIEHKAEQLYARLMQGPVRILTPGRTPHNPAPFEFFLKPTSFRQQTIVLHLPSGDFHTICAKRRAKDAEHVQRRITRAILAAFDAKRTRQLELVERAKALALPDAYPYLAAFVNEPYASEAPNCEFVDPDEWVPRVARMDARAYPHLAPLIDAARAQRSTSYLQRQAIVATRAIAVGQELLLRYSRDEELGTLVGAASRSRAGAVPR